MSSGARGAAGPWPAWTGPTARLAARSLSAQAIVTLAGLAVARLYTPSQVGAAAAFVAAVGVVAVISAWRYDLAVVVAEDDRDANTLMLLSVMLVLATAVIAGTALILAATSLARAAGRHGHLGTLRFAAPPAIAAIGLVAVALRWATRRRQYELIGRIRVRQAAAQASGQIGLGILGAGVWGLTLGAVAGSCVGGIRLAREPLHELWRQRPGGGWRRVKEVAGRYREYPSWSVLATFCTAAASVALPVLIAALYGLRVAGLYVLAQRVVLLPLRLVGDAVSRTFLGDASHLRATAPHALRARVRQTAGGLAVIGAVAIVVLVALGPRMFSWAFGARWAQAGVYARPLCVLAAAQLTVSPIAQAFAVVRRLRLQAALAVAQLVLSVGPALLAHALGGSPVVALSALSAGGAIACAGQLVAIDRIATDPGPVTEPLTL